MNKSFKYFCAVNENIHPIHDKILSRDQKESLLNQKSVCLWFTGLSGSGKSTLATELEKRLYSKGVLTQVLDGDNIRDGLNSNLGFSVEDRTENIRRIAELNKLFVNCGIVTLNCFVSPSEAIRKQAKEIVGEKDFIEIYVNAPLEVCEERDVKGLYAKARSGQIKNFTGIDAPFEAPVNPDLEILTGQQSLAESTEAVLKYLESRL
jgi:adenylylsulfate kinase